ncbi:MAG: hypothetical protein ACPIOQ_42095 [Promethearchaeia archaeon]
MWNALCTISSAPPPRRCFSTHSSGGAGTHEPCAEMMTLPELRKGGGKCQNAGGARSKLPSACRKSPAAQAPLPQPGGGRATGMRHACSRSDREGPAVAALLRQSALV